MGPAPIRYISGFQFPEASLRHRGGSKRRLPAQQFDVHAPTRVLRRRRKAESDMHAEENPLEPFAAQLHSKAGESVNEPTRSASTARASPMFSGLASRRRISDRCLMAKSRSSPAFPAANLTFSERRRGSTS